MEGIASTSGTDGMKALNVAKLKSADGFVLWSTKLKVFLKGTKLWPIVEGSRPRPVLPASGDSDAIAVITAKVESTAELDQWEIDDSRAQYYILSSASDEVLANSAIMGTAKELWDSICKGYGSARGEQTYQLYGRLSAVRMTSSDTF